MKIYDFKEYQQVYYTGDIHGFFSEFINDINVRKKITNSLIICCGDIGMGFYKIGYYIDLFNKLNKKLEKSNNTLCFIRGNHDNPGYFNTDRLNFIDENHVLFTYSHIKFISDYSIIQTIDGNILCIGGGISIDRVARILNKSYWDNEIILPIGDEEKDFITNSNLDIKIVCTHSSPDIAEPSTKYAGNWLSYDALLKQDLLVERKTLQDVYEYLTQKYNITHWIYGHFHQRYDTIINNTRFHCCDMFRCSKGENGADLFFININV